MSRGLNVLVITPLYPPAVGGAATYFGGTLPRVALREGLGRITVLTERSAGIGTPALGRDGGADGVCPIALEEDRLTILRRLPIRVSVPSRSWWGHAASYALTQVWFVLHLRRLVREHGIDVIHFHTRYRGRAFFHALGRCHRPVIADLRDRLTSVEPLIDVADHLICVIESVRSEAVKAGFPAERSSVVHTPLVIPEHLLRDRDAAADSIRRAYGLEHPYVLFVGDVAAHKGVPELIAGFGRWRAQHGVADLVIAGPRPAGAELGDEIDRAPHIRWLGPVARPDALALMAGARVVVRPSHRSEGLPRVIQEAAALGTPVLGPPGIPELDTQMPESVLDEVSPGAIERGLEAAWHRRTGPQLDLSAHDPDRVADALATVYRSVAARTTG